jgi:16S rRNA (cytosine967-C5)-methyltransferase
MAKPASPRDLARRVLARVREDRAYATLALSAELKRAGPALAPRDRALATELVYGVLRNRSRLDRALGAYAARGLGGVDARTLDALELGAYQLLFLRVPAHAAVDDAVGTVARARGAKLGGFVNALLRRLAREGEPPLPADPLERLLVAESCPRWIYDALAALGGADDAASLVRALAEPAPTGVRVTSRGPVEETTGRLAAERPEATIEPSPLSPRAFLVIGGGALSETVVYREGWLALQDPGAQAAGLMVDPQPGERILDACAGVGGKSMHLADLAGDRAVIDAVDVSDQKLALLEEHALRLGVRSVTPRRLDLRASEATAALGPYDAALLDAPCSGLGTLRRHPEAKWQRGPEQLAELSTLQAELLDRVAARVRPGGRLIYSVCTLTVPEGPAQIEAFVRAHAGWMADPARLVLPHRDRADGFFLCRLRRLGESC